MQIHRYACFQKDKQKENSYNKIMKSILWLLSIFLNIKYVLLYATQKHPIKTHLNKKLKWQISQINFSSKT